LRELALGNLMNRKTRTLISVLAVAVQVAFLLVLIGLSTGTLQEVGERIENVRSDLIVLPPGGKFMLAMSSAVMPLEPVRAALEATDGVHTAAPVVITTTNRFGAYTMVFGIDPLSWQIAGRGSYELVEGRTFEEPFEVVVDRRLARASDLEVGSVIELLNHDFTVSGIVKDGAGVRIYLPIATLQDLIGRAGKASAFFVRARDAEEVAVIKERLQASSAFKSYKMIASREYGELLGAATFGVKEFIGAVTLIAVVFGFLVISLVMYTSIIERTRQIGILKSLGAGRAFIARAFLIEGAATALLGIPVGVVLAVVVRSVLTTTYPTLTIIFTFQWMVYAAMIAIGAGTLGSLYPAVRASRVDPVVALSYD